MDTNALINETSPYLLQHAHNPVDWRAWSEEAFLEAQKNNKPVIVSIGYSSCHWCHVMEKESFEDEQTASIMNEHFICIKVDREEHPDVDAIYMDAVQLMTGRGGWPLNCITLPDKRPLYGGTYFTKAQWQQTLLKVAELYRNEPEQCNQYAADLTEGMQRLNTILRKSDSSEMDWKSVTKLFASQFDKENGGMNRSPKFPMPANWELLLMMHKKFSGEELLKQTGLTLKKMAFGGIYDQVGGGFARYSTDEFWKVPHFEKMLYDNAQLVSLYCNAYRVTKNNLYKDVVYETLNFIKREMTSAEGGFYSAIDADSEGVEGKYYIWNKNELIELLADDAQLVFDFFNINEYGYWEDEHYVLIRDKDDEEIAARFNISTTELKKKIAFCRKKMLEYREKRVRPGLDDKQICSWNALMLKGYAEAYRTFNEKDFLNAAVKNAELIINGFSDGDHLLRIYKNGKAKINGCLEDYVFSSEAFISLYQLTYDEKWLHHALSFMKVAIDEFYDEQSSMFFFTSIKNNELILRKIELQDNVIPSANSAAAKVLFLLSHYFSLPDYRGMSEQMVNNMHDDIQKQTPWYSNWAQAALIQKDFFEVVICGGNADQLNKSLNIYLPDALFAVTERYSSLPIFESRYQENETLIYICRNQSCFAPVKTSEEALKLLGKHI